MIRFTVQGRPQPKQRARVTKRGTYTPTPTKDYEGTIFAHAYNAARAAKVTVPLEGPVRVDIVAVLPRPKSLNRKKDPEGLMWAPVRPDADNIRKAVLDGLKGVLGDDGQVVCGETFKVYAEKDGQARTVVWIDKADDFALSVARDAVRVEPQGDYQRILEDAGVDPRTLRRAHRARNGLRVGLGRRQVSDVWLAVLITAAYGETRRRMTPAQRIICVDDVGTRMSFLVGLQLGEVKALLMYMKERKGG